MSGSQLVEGIICFAFLAFFLPVDFITPNICLHNCSIEMKCTILISTVVKVVKISYGGH